jgi:hypothetical protein
VRGLLSPSYVEDEEWREEDSGHLALVEILGLSYHRFEEAILPDGFLFFLPWKKVFGLGFLYEFG